MRYLTAYLATIVAANLAVAHLHPSPWYGLGLTAPAGVYFAGLVLVLRDYVHRQYGLRGSLVAVALGSLVSLLMAAPQFIVASVAAFAVAELLDLAVFIPATNRWGMAAGVALSGVVGSLVDSLLFLQLAFGSLAFFPGQFVGKLAMTAAAVAFIAWRAREGRRVPAPVPA